MGRPPKDGKYVNFLMDRKLASQLEKVSVIAGKSKTAIMEEALCKYIEPFCQSDGKINAVEAIYVKMGKSCVVLDTFALNVNSDIYHKIFVDGVILTVPMRDVVITG